ncbi:MAG: cell division protein FtsA [Gammaproteobacteria bacterium]
MSKKDPKNLIVGLDVGTSKVVALVAEISSGRHVEVIGIGSHPSYGLKRGVVVNIEATVQSIQRAIEEAELMAGCRINSAYAGIAGSHVRSLNSHGMVAIRDKEVLPLDIDRVIDAAKAVAIPADQRILHILPQEYAIDNQEGIREPVGMSGVRLEAKVHIVTGAVSAAQNLIKCVQKCGLQVEDIILEQLASSYAVLTEDEKELGVCMIDIGGGTTDIAVFTAGSIRHTAVIPIAGDQVTNDIAVALRTPTKHAEEIKIKYGSAIVHAIDQDSAIEVPNVVKRTPRQLSKKVLSEVIHARYEELFSLVLSELRRSGLEDAIPAGIVITGGASQIEGAIELAESVFQMPVRLGIPQHVKGLTDVLDSPMYATSVGLLLYGYQQQYEGRPELIVRNGMKGIWGRVKNWFQGNF